MKLSRAVRAAIEAAARGGARSLAITLPCGTARKEPRPLPRYCRLAPGPPGRWEVAIPDFLPTYLNVLKSAHWAVEARMKYADAQVIGQSLRAAGVSQARGKRRARFILVMGKGQRKPDGDAVFKSGLDALVRVGALVDDNPKWLDLLPTLYERQSAMGCRIILEDVA